jgi:hypothetical protein
MTETSSPPAATPPPPPPPAAADDDLLERSASASAMRFSRAEAELEGACASAPGGTTMSANARQLLLEQGRDLLNNSAAWGRASRALKLLEAIKSGQLALDLEVAGLLNELVRQGSQLDSQAAGDPAAVVLAVVEAQAEFCELSHKQYARLLHDACTLQAVLDSLLVVTKTERRASPEGQSEVARLTTAVLVLAGKLLKHRLEDPTAEGMLSDAHCRLLCQFALWRPPLTDQAALLQNDAHAGLALHCLRATLKVFQEAAGAGVGPADGETAAAAPPPLAVVDEVALSRMSSAEQLQHAMALSMGMDMPSGGSTAAAAAADGRLAGITASLLESNVGQTLTALGPAPDAAAVRKMLAGATLQLVHHLAAAANLAHELIDRAGAAASAPLLTPSEWAALQRSPYWDADVTHPPPATLRARSQPVSAISPSGGFSVEQAQVAPEGALQGGRRGRRKKGGNLDASLLSDVDQELGGGGGGGSPITPPGFYPEESAGRDAAGTTSSREGNLAAAHLVCADCIRFPGLLGACCCCYCFGTSARACAPPLRALATKLLGLLPYANEYSSPLLKRVASWFGGLVHLGCSVVHAWVVFGFFQSRLLEEPSTADGVLYYFGVVLLCLSACCLCTCGCVSCTDNFGWAEDIRAAVRDKKGPPERPRLLGLLLSPGKRHDRFAAHDVDESESCCVCLCAADCGWRGPQRRQRP